MAEKVIVKGGGTIDGAQFNNAATEATLLRLLDALRGKKDGASGDEAKLKELANRALKENNSLVGDSSAAYIDANKNVSGMGTAAKSASSVFGKLGDGVSSLASGVFSVAVGVGTQFVKFFTDSLDAFRETSSVGAGFNNDLVLLRRTAADAAMPLDEFTSMIGKNSKLLAALGGSVTGGAMSFASMSKEMRTSDFGQKMQGLGMTTGDLNDYLSGYLEIQQRSGKTQGKSQQELIAGAQEYAQEMDKLTKVTGVSRQQTQDALRTAMKDGRALTIASKLSGAALQNFQTGLTLMNTSIDPAAAASLTNMMAGVIDPADKFGKRLAIAAPGMRAFQEAVADGTVDAEGYASGMKDQEAAISKYLGGFSKQQIAMDPVLKQLAEFNASLQKYKTMSVAEAAAEQERSNKITTAMGSMRQMFDKLIGDITVKLIDSGVFERLQDGLQFIADKFLKYAPQFGTAFSDLIGDLGEAFEADSLMEGISNAFGVLFGRLTPIVGNLFRDLIEKMTGQGGKRKELEAKKKEFEKGAVGEGQGSAEELAEYKKIREELDKMNNADPFTGIGEALKSMFPILQSFDGALAGISWALENWKLVLGGGLIIALGTLAGMLGMASGGLGKAVTSLGEGIGNLIGSIGKGLGTAIGGILQGVGAGLASMGGPQAVLIVAGAAALGAAIPLIGAGIAGATWILGKALPTFAEGMRPFQELDGSNLLKVGLGIGAIGVAMAAMGAGSAIGGIGNMLGGLADGITGLFGGKTPFDKLKDFSKLDIDSEKIKYNSEGVVAFSTAMAALGAGGAVGSLGNLVSGLVGGITSFFGGEIKMPWDKLLDFQKLVFDGEKIKRNAEALTAFAGAMNNLPNIKSETTGGLIGAIGSFFSGSQVMPWDRLKEFGDVKLDGEKIKKNAEILGIFGDSIKTFQSSGTSVATVGADFASQASGVNTFTDSIKNLNKAIVELNSALSTIATSGKGLLGGGQSNLEVVTSALGGAANTGSNAASEKLNTLVTELVSLTKEIKDSSKDQADALSGRRTAV